MWPPWLRLERRLRTTPQPQPPSPSPSPSSSPSSTIQSLPRSFSFSCSSFKDINTLLQEEPEPASPKSPSLFRRLQISSSVLRSWGSRSLSASSHSVVTLPPDFDKGSVVVYYTSLRVVRGTFDDCRTVRSILRGFGIAIDERDVSMDDRLLEELQGILGRRNVALPRVFVGGAYVGGVDDVRKLYESGELQRLIERLPRSEPNVCDVCGGLRFVVCDECNGSHKVYTGKSGFRSCTSCNANGLVRCPACFFVLSCHTR